MESIRELSDKLLALESERMDSGRKALFSTLRLSRIGVNTMVQGALSLAVLRSSSLPPEVSTVFMTFESSSARLAAIFAAQTGQAHVDPQVTSPA